MGARPYNKREAGGVAKRQPKVAAGPVAHVNLAAMTRRHCPTCGPETLYAGNLCVNCGHDYMAPKQRGRGRPRRGWNGAKLKAPIAEGANILALMGAKA